MQLNFLLSVQIDELGRTLVNLSTLVPGGIVCFFPSYEYERKVHAHWERTGTLSRITQKKRVRKEICFVGAELGQLSSLITISGVQGAQTSFSGGSGSVSVC